MEALCKVEIPEVEGLNSGEMTVGRHLILNCESVPPSTDFTNVDFTKAQFKNEAPYTAKIFKAEAVSAANLKLDVTFYKTGDINLSDYILTDGVSEIKLSAEPIKVISVLKPREDGQPQQPYGPLFPIEIPVPTFYYVALVAVLLLTVLYSFFKANALLTIKN